MEPLRPMFRAESHITFAVSVQRFSTGNNHLRTCTLYDNQCHKMSMCFTKREKVKQILFKDCFIAARKAGGRMLRVKKNMKLFPKCGSMCFQLGIGTDIVNSTLD